MAENLPELSEIEKCVLERILLGEKSNKLASGCGITDIMLNVVIEKLVEKGYIDWELNPTDFAYRKLAWIDGVYPLEYYIDTRKYLRMVLEFAIAISFFMLVAFLAIYLRS
ncbi:MAG: hypothetical protein DSY33_01925 [Archaeoglobus sp.]|jgi:hypothetical protein|nr:MAG: hypothetical protein DSY33_01925 [Archaeoglobus sp.]